MAMGGVATTGVGIETVGVGTIQSPVVLEQA